jgi:hypothetical protein
MKATTQGDSKAFEGVHRPKVLDLDNFIIATNRQIIRTRTMATLAAT